MRGWLTRTAAARGPQLIGAHGEKAANRLLDVGQPDDSHAIALQIGKDVAGGRETDLLARHQAIRFEAVEGSLELADARPESLRDELERLLGDAGRQAGRLAGDDGPSRLQIGRLHAANDPGDETRHQLFAQFRQEPRMPVRAQDDLALVRFELLDRMEKFLLNDSLAVEEIDVVDDEHVNAAEPLAKAGKGPIPQCLREMVGEPLRRKEQDTQCGMAVRSRRYVASKRCVFPVPTPP